MSFFDQLTEQQKALTDAELVPLAWAYTNGDIEPSRLKVFLREEGLVLTDSIEGGRTGRLIDSNLPASIKASLNSLITAVFDENIAVRTGNMSLYETVGKPVFQTLGYLTQNAAGDASPYLSIDQFNAFYDLADGRPYKNFNEAAISQARTTYNLKNSDREAYSSTLEPVRFQPNITKAELLTAIDSYRSAIEGL